LAAFCADKRCAANVFMKVVKSEMMTHEHENQGTTSNAEAEAKDIERGRRHGAF
jgi:hypothetical protein